jgi:hypothetical protein
MYAAAELFDIHGPARQQRASYRPGANRAGKANQPVGAELRGTGSRVWRGMARGTRKDQGDFWIGASGSKAIVLCESAIDAIRCLQMQPDRICISTSGVRANPRWLSTRLSTRHRPFAGKFGIFSTCDIHPDC